MKLIVVLLAMLCPMAGLMSQNTDLTWKKLRSEAEVANLPKSLSPSAHDQKRGVVYVMDLQSTEKPVYEFDMATCQTKALQTNGSLPERIDNYTYDPEGRRLFCSRAGRDIVYSLDLDGDRTWKLYSNGSFDAQSYGSVFFWNSSTKRPSIFGGYGYFRMKNWVWEAQQDGWTSVIDDNGSCEPPRRAASSMMMLGNPDSSELFVYSGEGSCSGVQYEDCAFGTPWTQRNGFCWLRDIWKYDQKAQKFINVLPPGAASYKAEGAMSYDYTKKQFLLIPTTVPPFSDTNDTLCLPLTTVYMIDQATGTFTTKKVDGDVPPQKKLGELGTIQSYYDPQRDRVIYIRADGVWTLERAHTESLCPDMRQIESQSINVRLNSSWQSDVLLPGHTYVLKGQGEWSAANAPASDEDFCYTYPLPCDGSAFSRKDWIRVGFDIDSMLQGKGLLDPVEKGVDCQSHTYHYIVKGNGQRLTIDFRDTPLSDNSGTLSFTFYECVGCTTGNTSDSILGYRNVETHQVVTYALRNNPNLRYKWIATGGYMLGASTNHYCDVIWGYDQFGSVCCIVSDSTCTDSLCVTTTINGAAVSGVVDNEASTPTMSVHPNPATDMVDISTALGDSHAYFELVDVRGIVLQRVEGAQARMSVAMVAPGVYHIIQRDVMGNVIGIERIVIER